MQIIHFSKKSFIITYKTLFILFIVLAGTVSAGARARTIDTTLYGNGGPGPYSIGSTIIDSASLRISFPDSTTIPPWIYLSSLNAVLFSEPLDSGMEFRARFITVFYGVPHRYTGYPKITYSGNNL